jgi:lactate dehydrogenase-like 2-hydroxyacid dehydrogenase
VRVDALFRDAIPYLHSAVSTCAGVGIIDLAEFEGRGIAFANSGKVFSTDAVGLLLHVLRQVSNGGAVRAAWFLACAGGYRLGSKVMYDFVACFDFC